MGGKDVRKKTFELGREREQRNERPPCLKGGSGRWHGDRNVNIEKVDTHTLCSAVLLRVRNKTSPASPKAVRILTIVCVVVVASPFQRCVN